MKVKGGVSDVRGLGGEGNVRGLEGGVDVRGLGGKGVGFGEKCNGRGKRTFV